jgi:hypothetical protein
MTFIALPYLVGNVSANRNCNQIPHTFKRLSYPDGTTPYGDANSEGICRKQGMGWRRARRPQLFS